MQPRAFEPDGQPGSAGLTDRRAEPRTRASAAGEMMWLDADAQLNNCSVELSGASLRGRDLLVREPVPVGQTVVVVFDDGAPSLGVTRYCQPVESGYRVGIQLPPLDAAAGRGTRYDLKVVKTCT